MKALFSIFFSLRKIHQAKPFLSWVRWRWCSQLLFIRVQVWCFLKHFLFVPLSFLSSSFLKPKCHSKDRQRTFFKMFWGKRTISQTFVLRAFHVRKIWLRSQLDVTFIKFGPQNILKKVRSLSFEWHFGLRKAGDKTAKEQKEIYFPFWHETKRDLK